MPRIQSLLGLLGLIFTLIALVAQPLYTRAIVFGLLRPQDKFESIHGLEKLRSVPGTGQCEDLHHHLPSNQLYTACQDDAKLRLQWFPPLALFQSHKKLNTGSITVIDPETFTSKRLKLKGFKGPFITHGIDLFSPPDDPTLLYIFAVNHLPNPHHWDATSTESKSPDRARSQVELFKYKIGSDDAEFVRSIRHPLIRTPNDIYATAPDEFYVTNDHFYREGSLRMVEDIMPPQVVSWTDTVFVQINKLDESIDPEAGLTVTQALRGMHNNNGLGHGSRHNPQEVLVADAAGGIMHRAKRALEPAKSPHLHLLDSFQLHSTIDNPSYYEDPYATKKSNASGYVVPGLGRAIELADNFHVPNLPLPSMVWHLRQDSNASNATNGGWNPRLIFQDSGHKVRSASGSVIVGIDPKTNAGKKQGWLFVTGFATQSLVAAKIDL